jgi:hypothetical protein
VLCDPRSHTVPSTFLPSQSFFKDAKEEFQAFEYQILAFSTWEALLLKAFALLCGLCGKKATAKKSKKRVSVCWPIIDPSTYLLSPAFFKSTKRETQAFEYQILALSNWKTSRLKTFALLRGLCG